MIPYQTKATSFALPCLIPVTEMSAPSHPPTGTPKLSPSKCALGKKLKPFNTGDIKVLLLENVNVTAITMLTEAGYQVEHHKGALDEAVLIEKIRDVHAIGIRSKTQLSENVLTEAKKLLAVGCFCIGTNQVDLAYASSRGIPVFNSPFSNSRSVAELVIAEIVALSRQMGDRNNEMHQGIWNKVSAECYEIRGKTLGIIGYGHIGSQLSVLAESMGLKVLFYDTIQIMPLGTARQTATLDDLLSAVDYVTLHVPETEETKNMIGEREIGLMKKGAYLINASRGTVVDIPALVKALKSRHLGGCAVDVYPEEPKTNGKNFQSELIGCPNTILTPHIGGSTEEAQSMIGVEVATALVKLINAGSTIASVNHPECDLRMIPADSKGARILYTHKNVPGVLKKINNILSDHNVEKQICDSKGEVAYLMADVSDCTAADLLKIYTAISSTEANIQTRILF